MLIRKLQTVFQSFYFYILYSGISSMSVFNQSRSRVIRLIIVTAFVVILAQLFNLQIISGRYKKLADDNTIFRKTIYPSRGIIFDRNNKAILNNTLMYDLMVIPSEVRGVDTAFLCNLLEIDIAEFNRRIVNSIIRNGRYRPSAFESLLSPQKYARMEENMWRMGNGFYLLERPVRLYPYNVAAHILGYIGEVDSNIIKRSNNFYRLGDYVGISGLETYYESVLMGQRGMQFWLRDNKNRLVARYENREFDTAAIPGRNLRTYLDVDLQVLAEKLMTNKVGAVVAIEPKTGGILAMVSSPNFNPNALTGSERTKNYSKLIRHVSSPLLNRAIKGLYPPGSTFKPIGALVALNEGVITASYGYSCGGAYYGCRRPVKCSHSNPGHAANLRLAIANSCNSYFTHIYRLSVDNSRLGGVKKGYHKWKEYMNDFGLGERLGVDLPSEDRGNVPDTARYNREYRGRWNSCTNLSLGIGQDMMLVTPLQLANAMCIIANKGYYYTPHFVRKIDDETEADTILNPFRKKHEVLTHISDTAFQSVILGMQDVTDFGTARVAKIPGINVCSKTGTSENYRIIDGKRGKLPNNSMFVSFAPRENPKIVIAVVVENAGYGSTWAGPIASLLMEKYLNDTLRPERVAEVERIANANLMPAWMVREQKKQDSLRAITWFKMTKDSSYLKKQVNIPLQEKEKPNPGFPKKAAKETWAILANEKTPGKRQIA